jgi:hypothetical protein
MMDHKPAAVSKNEKVGCCRQPGVKARFVEDRYVFSTGHPGKVSIHVDPHVGRRGPQFLPTLKNHFPAFAHAIPSGQQVPSGVHTPYPVFVRPYIIHPLEHSGFERAVESCVCLLDRNSVFNIHTRAKTIPQSAANSSRLQDCSGVISLFVPSWTLKYDSIIIYAPL